MNATTGTARQTGVAERHYGTTTQNKPGKIIRFIRLRTNLDFGIEIKESVNALPQLGFDLFS